MSSYSVVIAREAMGRYRGLPRTEFEEIDSTLHELARTLADPKAGAWLQPGRQHWLLNGERWMDYEIDRAARTVTLLAFGTFPHQRAVAPTDRSTRAAEKIWDSEGGANHRSGGDLPH